MTAHSFTPGQNPRGFCSDEPAVWEATQKCSGDEETNDERAHYPLTTYYRVPSVITDIA